MLKINKEGNYIKVVGEENKLFPDNGSITFPLNSLALTIDESDIATFRSAANNDVIFSAMIDELTISDNAVSKDDIMSAWALVAYSTAGGGGGEGGAVNSVNGQTGDVVLTASSISAYSKSETNNLLAEKADNDDITALTDEISGIHTTTDAHNTRITENAEKIGDLDVEMGEVKADIALKQDELVSGTNIKTINNQSILGSGNIVIEGGGTVDAYTKQETNNLLAEKVGNNQALSVQSTSIYGENNNIMFNKYSVDNTVQDQDIINFKTINGNNILGSGDITISSGGTIDAYTKQEANQLFVLIETYNAKITELEGRIAALESSLGTVSTTLDSINGEVIE